MITTQLINFVRGQLAAGAKSDRIAEVLAENGWPDRDIDSAIAAAKKTPAVAPVTSTSWLAGRKVLLSVAFVLVSVVYGSWSYIRGLLPPDDEAVARLPQSSVTPGAGTTQTASTTTGTTTTRSTATNAALPAPSGQSRSTAQSAPATSSAPAPTSAPAPAPAPAPTPAPAPSGQYADGTYNGSVANAYYGYVQVQAVVQGGRIAQVNVLQHPNDRRTSQIINGQAMPMLQQEAVTAQSAYIDLISGATDSSLAFVQSLKSALAQAKK